MTLVKIDNDLISEDDKRFKFSYDNVSSSYGYNIDGDFHPFSSGGTDISDTTAVPSVVLSGYYFYTSDGTKTEGSVNINNASDITISGSHTYNSGYYPTQWTVTSSGIDTSDATAIARNIEKGYTAYCRGVKITGNAYVDHGVIAYPNSVAQFPKQALYQTVSSCDEYVMFLGGSNLQQSTIYNDIYIYDTNLTRNTSVSLPENKYYFACVNLNGYSIIVGGQTTSSVQTKVDTAHVINTNYTISTISSLNKSKSFTEYNDGRIAGNIKDTYAIFPGGVYAVDGSYRFDTVVDVYDTSFTKSVAAQNDIDGRQYRTFGSVGNYCIEIGDASTAHISNVAYNLSLTRQIVADTPIQADTSLRRYTNHPSGVKRGNYCLFGGGGYYKSKNYDSAAVCAFDSDLVLSTPASLSSAKGRPFSGELLYFSAFVQPGNNNIDLYDDSLVHKYVTISNIFNGFGTYCTFGVIDKHFGILGGGEGANPSKVAVIVET